MDFWLSLAAALAASPHCVGMCGGFAIAASKEAALARPLRVVPSRGLLATQALYHLGKSTTYLFLGAVAVVLGLWISRAGSLGARSLSWLAALVLFALGADALGLLGGVRAWLRSRSLPGAGRGWGATCAGAGARLLRAKGALRPLMIGMLSGLLPCPLVWGFLARASATGSVVTASISLVALGLGSMPLLLATAWAGSAILPHRLEAWRRVSGLLWIALGAWTLWRGLAELPCCPP